MSLYYGGLENASSSFPRFTTMPLQPVMSGSGKLHGRKRRARKQKGGALALPRRAIGPIRAPPPPPKPPAKPKTLFERAKDFLKQHKLVSKGLNFGADLLSKTDNYKHLAGLAKGAATAAELSGYGKRKRRSTKRKTTTKRKTKARKH